MKDKQYYSTLLKKIRLDLKADGFGSFEYSVSEKNNGMCSVSVMNKTCSFVITNLNKKSDEEISYKIGERLSKGCAKPINESLKKEENRKKFRELVMKYHPDKGGDNSIMARINASKVSDEVFERLYNELSGKAVVKSSTEKRIKNFAEYEKVFDSINTYLEREGKPEVFYVIFSDGRVTFSLHDRRFTMFNIDKFASKEELAKKAYEKIQEEFFKKR